MPKPFNDSNEVYFLAVVPILLTIFLSISFQVMVYLKVRKQVRASWKWSFGISTNSAFSMSSVRSLGKKGNSKGNSEEIEVPNVQRKQNRTDRHQSGHGKSKGILTSTNVEAAVFWQAAFYVFVLMISWPMVVATILFARWTIDMFAFWAVFVFVAPVQGFLNCMVYIRPRVMEWRRQRRLQRRRRRRQEEDGMARKEEFAEHLESGNASDSDVSKVATPCNSSDEMYGEGI